jgi:hypothetical protein
MPAPFEITEPVSEHFISITPRKGLYESRQMDPPEAELAFYYTIHGHRPLIFRENSGAYIALAPRAIMRHPTLKMSFNRTDLRAEQIQFDHGKNQPPHKVRFLIHDKGGRNRREDLREHILSYSLDADL